MANRRTRLPLKRQMADPQFWIKLTALYHRERMRETYATTGDRSHEARHRANREAHDVAVRHGWRGDVARLKAELAEFVVNEMPGRGKRRAGRRVGYWEEQVHVDMLRMLALDARALAAELESYLYGEIELYGPFTGRGGFYRLTHIVGYVPPMEHMGRRNAFLGALHRIGHDGRCCDPELYKIVLRLLRQYTRRPFETRLGIPMPGTTERPVRRRKLLGFIPR